jgi:hypothetical protein
MEKRSKVLVLALSAALVAVSSLASGSDLPTLAELDLTIPHEAIARDAAADRAEAGQATGSAERKHHNSPHPAVQSFEHPVYPVGVPNPPVSLERY